MSGPADDVPVQTKAPGTLPSEERPSPSRTQPALGAARRALPGVLVLPAAAAAVFFALPLLALVWRAPWPRLGQWLAAPATVDALLLSLRCSVAAAAASFVFGLPLAAWLASGASRLRTVVRVLVTLPMVLPPVVGGVAMLLAYGRKGIVGAAADGWLGLVLPFTTEGVIVAETYVAMPFLVLTVEGGLRSLDPRFAAAAATLGAGPWRSFRTVILPMLAPSLRAGLLVAWARALGEFGATITFAGNLEGKTRTLPLAVYGALETEPEAAIALSLLLVAISAAVLIALRRRWFPLR
ncbi:MAG: molybdate ABC transporter permease subunit [Planctomycetota bacterium]